jgi:hypothetical protein
MSVIITRTEIRIPSIMRPPLWPGKMASRASARTVRNTSVRAKVIVLPEYEKTANQATLPTE